EEAADARNVVAGDLEIARLADGLRAGVDQVGGHGDPVTDKLDGPGQGQRRAECAARVARAANSLLGDVRCRDDAERRLEMLDLMELVGEDLPEARGQGLAIRVG